MLIRNTTWIDACGCPQSGALLVRNERVHLLTPAEANTVTDVETVDGSERLVLPGLVDAHTHFREPGQAYKEGIENASFAALKGGVTTILDMPNNRPAINSAAHLAAKRALFAVQCRTRWGLHVQAPVADVAALGAYASAKLYMAKSSDLPAVHALAAITQVLTSHRVVTVHAEDEAAFVNVSPGHGSRVHHLHRPREAVRQALKTLQVVLETLPEKQQPRLVLCHMSTADEVVWLRQMKARGFDLWGETCPHYLWFSEVDYLRDGARYKVNPPLRTVVDVAAIRDALRDGTVDFISSDHAPHTPAEKADEATAPSGIAGIEWQAPALVHLVEQGLCDWRRALAASTHAPACCFRLACGKSIEQGSPADLILLARGRPVGPIVSRAQVDPYANLPLAWHVESTFIGGNLCYDARTASPSVIQNPAPEILYES